MSFREIITKDLVRYKAPVHQDSSRLSLFKHTIYFLIFSPGFSCVFWFRVNNILSKKTKIISKLLGAMRYYTFANDISFRAEIGSGFKVSHVSDIVIGGEAKIGKNVTIYNGVTIGAKDFDKPYLKPKIGNDVIISTGAKVLGDITVGNNVVIGALTFCNKSVPDNSVAYGNPMVIKSKDKK